MASHSAESPSSCTTMFQRPLRTSELCLPVRRVTVTRTLSSTESFPNSCCKVVTSPDSTEPVESPSTVRNSQMRTSSTDTPSQVCCLWLTPVQTPTDPNSSSPPFHAHGWTVSTLSSVRSLMVSTLSRRSSPWVLTPVRPEARSRLSTLVSSKQLATTGCTYHDRT